jgi:hypothetical protein
MTFNATSGINIDAVQYTSNDLDVDPVKDGED